MAAVLYNFTHKQHTEQHNNFDWNDQSHVSYSSPNIRGIISNSWDGRGTWHARGRIEIRKEFWRGNLRGLLEEFDVNGRIILKCTLREIDWKNK